MAFKVRIAQEGERQLIPEGTYEAVVYQLVEMGTQPSSFGPDKNRLSIGWEIPSLRVEVDGKDMPRGFWQTYNLPEEGKGLHPKSNLRKMLVKWRGKDFTPKEMEGFDLKVLLGKPCIITIEHELSEYTNKMRDVLLTIKKWPQDKPALQPENELQYFSFQEKMDIPDNLPDWMRKAIMDSYEYQEMMNSTSQDVPIAPDTPDDFNDIPF